MNHLFLTFLLPLLIVALAPVPTLADEVAAERARIANQRIQVEEERRAREAEEQRAREEAERRALEEKQKRGETTSEPPSSDNDLSDAPPAGRIEMSRALEQLRELGALRDAGYVTDEEFEQLKKKILDGAL